MSRGDHELIQVKVNLAGTGKTRDQSSSLVRPFRLLMDEGKPIGRINYLFYSSQTLRVLGVLCHTPAGRLLFFPGLVGRIPRWYNKDNRIAYPTIAPGTVIDHLTLESDFKSFHATLLGQQSNKSVLTSRKTVPVKDGLTYWFGLSMQSDKVLEECPEEFEFQFSSPPNDTKRRLEIVLESRDGAKFHVIEQNPLAKPSPKNYIHFDYFVDTRGGFLRWLRKWQLGKDLLSAPTTAPVGPPTLREAIPLPPQVPIRAHPVMIPGFKGIVWVVSALRNGELVEQALIGSL